MTQTSEEAPFKVGDRVTWKGEKGEGEGRVYSVTHFYGRWSICAENSTRTRGWCGWSNHFAHAPKRSPYGATPGGGVY